MLKQILLGIVAVAAAGIASYFGLVRGPLERLEKVRARHFELQREYIERQKYRVNLPLLRTQTPVMEDLDKAAKIVLPDFDGIGAGPRDLETAIREAAKEKRITSRLEFTTGDWSSKEFYYFRPFSVQVSGEFRQVVEFAQLVSTGSVELRTIKTAMLRPVAGRGEVTLSLEALAFRYREEESAAAERKAKTRASVGQTQ
jgi:Tfp pilus assembly protein PilO